jgi:hypothetical protein
MNKLPVLSGKKCIKAAENISHTKEGEFRKMSEKSKDEQ